MSNNRERLAREWATSTLPRGDAKTLAAIEHILATTTEPTMADVDWDDEKHYLAGAVDADGHEVVMFGTFMGTIRVCDVSEVNNEFAPVLENPGTLTPNGKRYELVEVTGDEHPETLRTLEDYRIATVGTIVAYADGHAWTKTASGAWRQGKDRRTNREMAGTERLVLRWGWGE